VRVGRAFVFDPAKPGDRLHFWWFDPRTGTNIDLGIIKGVAISRDSTLERRKSRLGSGL
jgi:hypothetical protein